LIEIASKGGNYMLNIGPTGLGGVPMESVDCLEAVGKWLDVNGDAVYGTRKWEITKEGPTKIELAGTEQRQEVGFSAEFTAEDFWFTQKGSSLYAISLASAEETALIKAFSDKIGEIKSVEVLGKGAVRFEQSANGLKVIGGSKTCLPTAFFKTSHPIRLAKLLLLGGQFRGGRAFDYSFLHELDAVTSLGCHCRILSFR